MGETISAAKVTFMRCLWSVGVVALLSAGPSCYFCIQQLLFPCLEVLDLSASPPHAVGCKVLPGLSVDVKCFHVSLADILVAQLWAAFGSPSRCQLSIENVFWDACLPYHQIRENHHQQHKHTIKAAKSGSLHIIGVICIFSSKLHSRFSCVNRAGKHPTLSRVMSSNGSIASISQGLVCNYGLAV